jgi:hypothetical protein
MSKDIYWALLPNSQKGMRHGQRDIWHLMVLFNPLDTPWNRGYSCYKERGKYYSACIAGIPDYRKISTQDYKPPSKDCCYNCVHLYNHKYKGKVSENT